MSDKVRSKMIDYGATLAARPDFRRQEMTAHGLVETYQRDPACVAERLEPKTNYDVDTLARRVRKNIPAEVRDDYLDDLAAGRRTTIHAVQKLLHDEQAVNYQPPARLRRLIGTKESGDLGVLNELANELCGELLGAGHQCSIGEVIKATIVAAKTVFGFKGDDDARNGGPLDLPAYHAAILTRYRNEVQKIAKGALIRWGALGETHRRFGQ
jgi:hypothetical protein